MGDVTPEFLAAVSGYTGVPVQFLSDDSPAAVWDSAQRLVDWKTSMAAPQPPTAAVPASPPPTRVSTPHEIVNGAGDYLAAWRSGKLADSGAPAPPQRAPRDRLGMPW